MFGYFYFNAGFYNKFDSIYNTGVNNMSNVVGAFAISTCRCADSECEHRQEIIPELLPKKEDRVKGQIYINKKGEKGTWNGNRLLCEHGKQKSTCKECGGSSICEHSKRKSECKECGGSNICEHGKRKSYCKECGGSQICEHGKQKSYCKECGGSSLCKHDWCDTTAIPKYEGYCMPCFVKNPLNADKPAHRNYKTKEKEVALAITQRFPDATWILDKKIQDGCSARRPDVLMDLGYHVLMVEVDENRHNNYDCSCENKRLMELAQDLGHRSMVVIRFNPDAYETLQGERVPSCWKHNKKGIVHIPKEQQKNWDARIEVLLETIKYWIDNQSEKQIEIVELFYS